PDLRPSSQASGGSASGRPSSRRSRRSSAGSGGSAISTDRASSGPDDAQSRVFLALKQRGDVEQLKAHLRKRLFEAIQQQQQLPKQQLPREMDDIDRAAATLVAEHLRTAGFPYSLSVFVPESGLSSGGLLDRNSLQELLRLPADGGFHRRLVAAPDGASVLRTVLQHLAEAGGGAGGVNAGVQTAESHPAEALLAARMAAIDSQFDQRARQQKRQPESSAASVEAALLQCRRETEERMRKQLQADMQRFREGELAKVRLEERVAMQKELEARRREMEAEYRLRFTRLVDREGSCDDALARQLKEQERECYLRRQTLLEQIDLAKERENQLRRDREAWEREQTVRQEQLRALDQSLVDRETKLKASELSLETRLKDEVAKMKLSEETKYFQKWKELELQDARNKEERAIIEREREASRKLREDLMQRQSLLNEMEVADYPRLKEENAALKREIELLNNRAAELRIECESERQRAQRTSQDSGQELERLRQAAAALEQQRSGLERRLQEEAANASRCQSEAEAARQEAAELRRQLTAAEEALAAADRQAQLLQLRQLAGGSAQPPRSARSFGVGSARVAPSEIGGGDDDGGDEEGESLNQAYRSFQHRLQQSVFQPPPQPHQRQRLLQSNSNAAEMAPDNDEDDDEASDSRWLLGNSQRRLVGSPPNQERHHQLTGDWDSRQFGSDPASIPYGGISLDNLEKRGDASVQRGEGGGGGGSGLDKTEAEAAKPASPKHLAAVTFDLGTASSGKSSTAQQEQQEQEQQSQFPEQPDHVNYSGHTSHDVGSSGDILGPQEAQSQPETLMLSLDETWKTSKTASEENLDDQPEKPEAAAAAPAGVDPVMQKYMSMVAKRREEEKQGQQRPPEPPKARSRVTVSYSPDPSDEDEGGISDGGGGRGGNAGRDSSDASDPKKDNSEGFW
uniref:LisH domain-containing protein n=1 Tax=Macrostomum lignano TaxID=282301 RepID=A0A1I8HK76_9PLAT